MSITTKRGFTLLELMLTVMVLSVCLVAVIKGLYLNLKAIRTAEEYTGAIGILDGAMVRMLASQASPESAIAASPAPEGFELRLSTAPLTQGSSEDHLQQVDLGVHWAAAGKAKSISLSTLFSGQAAKANEATEDIGDLSQRSN